VGAAAVTLDDVLAARETIGGRLHRTPVLGSRTLGARTFLKAELFQRTGSFKPRGMLNRVALFTPAERARGAIAISAGNAAQGLAWACAAEGVDALVVMWRGASEVKLAATRAYGAEVDTIAADIPSAFARLEELIEETGRVLVHPFDDPLVIAGHGTLALELLEDLPEVDVAVVPVGGGGLVSGVAVALKEARPKARVVAVEPELSPALHEALRAGQRVEVRPRSIADGLNAPHAGRNCLELCTRLGVQSVLVSEEELKAGFRFAYERCKLACEPAGAAGIAAVLAGKVPAEQGETVVAVVSGGNVAPETASAILAGR
jgi:threonine dehydratase